MKLKKRSSTSNKTLRPHLITDMRPLNHQANPMVKFRKYIEKNIRPVGITIMLAIVAVVILIATQKSPTEGEIKRDATIKSIKQHMLLPEDEDPTFAVVEDKKALKDPFLAARAENNDRVLIYTRTQMAIIYRPGIDRIVAVGKVTADLALAEAEDTSATILNGNKDKDKTQRIIAKVKSLYPNLNVNDGGESNKKDFPNTIIIDNTNVKDELVEALVKAIPAKRGVVPLSEGASSSNLLIIVGKD